MDHMKLVQRFRIDKPKRFCLTDISPGDTCGLDIERAEAKAALAIDIERLVEMQKRLFAQDTWSVLIILQGMDTSGKDSAISHVASGLNPQGVDVYSFKAPSAEELDHDFLWRTNARLPRQGRIGIFNRSYYEEVLAVRVKPDLLARQNLPPPLVTKHIWKDRFADISASERYLTRNGVVILKFFLHISKAEQKRRFLERLDDPAKRWKFSIEDVENRRLWSRYMAAYEDMIRHTSTEYAPWHVVLADNKWFARMTVAAALVEALEGLKLEFPKVEGVALRRLQRARRALVAERG